MGQLGRIRAAEEQAEDAISGAEADDFHLY